MTPHDPSRLAIQTLEERVWIFPHAKGLEAELGVVRVGIVCTDNLVQVSAGRVARRGLETIDHCDVGVAALDEMVCGGGSKDTSADDENRRFATHGEATWRVDDMRF